MNILHTNFHHGEGGGHTTYILSLLKNSRHNHFVACPPTSLLYTTLAEQGAQNIIPLVFPGKMKHLKEMPESTSKLKAAILEHDIDIVHTNGSADNRIALYASLITKKKFKVVFTKHIAVMNSRNIISRMRLNLFNDAVIFVGDFIERLGLNPKYKKYHVIPHGIELDYWQNTNPANTGCNLTLISNAGANRYKGWQHLLEAIAGLPEKDRKRLSVVMLARYEPNMANEFKQAGQICNFEYPGFVDDARPYMKKADIGFVLSYREGCSFACREMLAMGLPVITSDFPVLVNNIDESCGWVTETKNPESIRAVLRTILELSPEQLNQMKIAARKKAEVEFSLQTMLDRTDAVYDLIMEK